MYLFIFEYFEAFLGFFFGLEDFKQDFKNAFSSFLNWCLDFSTSIYRPHSENYPPPQVVKPDMADPFGAAGAKLSPKDIIPLQVPRPFC